MYAPVHAQSDVPRCSIQVARSPPALTPLPPFAALLPPTPPRCCRRLPPPVQMADYVQKHDVQGVLKELLQKLLVEKPGAPLEWLAQEVAANPPFASGAPEEAKE